MKRSLPLAALIFLFCGFSTPKPRILIIGDSISIGYFPFVQEHFNNKAIVVHNPGNAQHTGTGLQKIHGWLENEKWDVIQFNWGLWDIAYRDPSSKKPGQRDKVNGKVTYTPEEYANNLNLLVGILKKTGAKLVFVTTTYVPEDEPGRQSRDPQLYNAIAKKIMKDNGIRINDIFGKSRRIHKKEGKGNKDVHYTEEGYRMLSEPICQTLDKILP